MWWRAVYRLNASGVLGRHMGRDDAGAILVAPMDYERPEIDLFRPWSEVSLEGILRV